MTVMHATDMKATGAKAVDVKVSEGQTAEVKVTEVRSRRDWNAFYELGRSLYRNDPVHVMEVEQAVREDLDSRRNPVFQYCSAQAFLAWRGNEPVARAVAIDNPRISEEFGRPTGLIGYFESADDALAARSVLDRCARWCAERGAQEILGDVHFSLNYQVGIQTSGFKAPHTFLMPHQPDYYAALFEQAGFKSRKRLHAYQVDLTGPDRVDPSVYERSQALVAEGFRVRPMCQEDLWPCLLDYNSTWSGNYGHTPLTMKELEHLRKSMGRFLDLEFCFVVEKQDSLAGYLFTFPDFHTRMRDWRGKLGPLQLLDFVWNFKLRRRVVGLKTAIIGVTRDFRGKQLSALLNTALLERARKHGCRYIERSWILEDNSPSIKQARRLGGTLYKTWDIFGLDLPGDGFPLLSQAPVQGVGNPSKSSKLSA